MSDVTKSPREFPRMDTEDGWTPLEFYAYVVRNLGMPARFRLEGKEWVADGPFTPPSERVLNLLVEHGA